MAPRFQDQYDTANNRDAEAGLSKTPIQQVSPGLPPAGTGNANGQIIGDPEQTSQSRDMQDADWLQLVVQAKTAAETNLNPLRNIWANNYRALNNLHASQSKYNTDKYRGRSNLHRPKTRTAVKKANAGAANALFATSDVVSIEATNPLDERHKASAEINKALLNYRLDRKSGKAGVPWFQIAVGAHNDSICTGLCVSKQYWERRELDTGMMETVPVKDEQTGQPQMQAVVDPMTGLPAMDPATGAPAMQPVTIQQPKMKVIRDRPMIRLFPPELVLRDPGADWLDQAQESSYIGLMHSITIGDLEAMMNDPQTKAKNIKYRKIERSIPLSARIGSSTGATTPARETGGNPQREQTTTGNQEYDRIWIIEWFLRYQGREFVFWTVGSTCLLSDPVDVEMAYPEQKGERPIVIGVGNVEPHKIDPMSMVQSIIPLQQEMNDLVNLRMDGVKDGVRPLAMVKKGKNIDVKAIQHRSGDAAIYVTDKDDVSFDRPGSIGGEAYTEMNYLNADFDDAVGQFNGGSVTTNRQLNETVGGMKLLNSSANIVGDFDLRVWIETYVEPTLRQVVRLEQYYEDDATILAIAGEKAKLYMKYGINEIDDNLLTQELGVTVNAGIGNADPMVKLDKLLKVGAGIGSLLGQSVQDRAKQDAFIDEAFGAAGFRDAAERFFHPGDGQDPRFVKMQGVIQGLQAKVDEKQSALDTQVEIKRIGSATELAKQYLAGIQQKEQAEATAKQTATMAGIEHAHDTKKTETLGKQKTEQIATQGKFKAAGAKPNGAAAPAAKVEADPVADTVEGTAAAMSQALLQSLLPMIIGTAQPPAAPPNPLQQAQAQPPQQAAPQSDPQMMQFMQMLAGMMQQQGQIMQGITQAINGLAAAQAAPKTVKKNPDGSFTAMAQPSSQPMLMQ